MLGIAVISFHPFNVLACLSLSRKQGSKVSHNSATIIFNYFLTRDRHRVYGPRNERIERMKEIDMICNRHMARLLDELEEANCPAIYRNAVKGKLQWLRKDLNEMIDGEQDDNQPARP